MAPMFRVGLSLTTAALRLHQAAWALTTSNTIHTSPRNAFGLRHRYRHSFGDSTFVSFSLQTKNHRSFHRSSSVDLQDEEMGGSGSGSGSDNGNDNDNGNLELKMENLYLEWTIDDDKLLYENMKHESLPKLASMLGRGLRGVEARIAKLNDVNSNVYERLFVTHGVKKQFQEDDNKGQRGGKGKGNAQESKLTPVKEVMRRVQWDYMLDPTDFTVEYWDRVEETIMSSPFDAKNDSVKGREEMFVFAIPEHRIQVIKYKERIVWDKQKRIDRVFGSMNGYGETIDQVMESYSEWKQKQDEIDAYNKQRQKEMAIQLKSVLGEYLFAALKDISSTIQSKSKSGMVEDKDIEEYVQDAIFLFQKSRNLVASSGHGHGDSDGGDNGGDLHQPITHTNIPQNDVEALDMFSNLVALLPDDDLRESILQEIYKQVNKLDPSRSQSNSSSTSSNNRTKSKDNHQQLPPLIEDDISESFVRGSGAGGQKINKTSNRVVLVHEPTQIRVECQDTRSLQQNRKIARKRLALKLDEFWNGSQSKNQKKIAKKVNKKQKTKAKNRARARKRRLEAAAKNGNSSNEDEFN